MCSMHIAASRSTTLSAKHKLVCHDAIWTCRALHPYLHAGSTPSARRSLP
jgi:hypothetical protein